MKNIEQEILAYAKAQAPHEMCGFLLRDYMDGTPFFYPCKNVASEPENYFEISPEEQIESEKLGWIEAIVHSPPNGEPTLSLADRQMMSQNDCDWILVCDNKLHIFPKIQPLVGREFIHGKTDCYTLFRDFYFLAGADLPQFEREDDWWKNGQDLYLANMEANGFKRLNLEET
ncbi:C40 family peptidase [Actinobacillus minor]|uniref:C40 family peptidase n=1 Tax=Actinobacillus minor TaxID=51047 RepID=UPI002A81EABC|nr:C40 family peptidase [Actinobacillus minor]MDY4714193.1 C40 family peptidase [Actinobacillus minor]